MDVICVDSRYHKQVSQGLFHALANELDTSGQLKWTFTSEGPGHRLTWRCTLVVAGGASITTPPYFSKAAAANHAARQWLLDNHSDIVTPSTTQLSMDARVAALEARVAALEKK